eukprot:3878428-Pleurochrysis_carterae.AAC.1
MQLEGRSRTLTRDARHVLLRSGCTDMWRSASRTRLTHLSRTYRRTSFPPPLPGSRRSSQSNRR